jgi:hypothetical protein
VGPDNEREEQAIRRATDRLVRTFADTHTATDVETTVAEIYRHFEGHTVRDFVPVLVERMARRRLAVAGSAPGPDAQAGDFDPTDEELLAAELYGDEAIDPELAWEETEFIVPQSDPGRPAARFRFGDKRLIGLAVGVVVVVVALILGVTLSGSSKPATSSAAAAPPAPSLTTVRGVVGSEKMPFFTDPKVIAAFAQHGLRVNVEPAGSRQIATSVDLNRYDFAFPSSEQAAERVLRDRPGSAPTKYTPFSSPMAIATYRPILNVLIRNGLVKPGPIPTFDMSGYLYLVSNNTRWDQLVGNTAYPVGKNILISSTDPRTSNSAAMYLAVASYIANGGTMVSSPVQVQNVLPTVAPLFTGQGYTDNSSQGPFTRYLADDIGSTPLVWIYEAQFVDATLHGQIKPDMVLMYPSPTVLSEHTLVPLDGSGDKVGQLLSTDPTLQRLAAEHGFRTGDPNQFDQVVASHHVPVAENVLDVVETPTYDTLQQLLDGVAKAYN